MTDAPAIQIGEDDNNEELVVLVVYGIPICAFPWTSEKGNALLRLHNEFPDFQVKDPA